ncbi:MAG: hypothetical protein JXR96_26790 [Deltaproteobacteria bacterium]|nr:hypothetical protein [Deltaproteobacteria bacterium]
MRRFAFSRVEADSGDALELVYDGRQLLIPGPGGEHSISIHEIDRLIHADPPPDSEALRGLVIFHRGARSVVPLADPKALLDAVWEDQPRLRELMYLAGSAEGQKLVHYRPASAPPEIERHPALWAWVVGMLAALFATAFIGGGVQLEGWGMLASLAVGGVLVISALAACLQALRIRREPAPPDPLSREDKEA